MLLEFELVSVTVQKQYFLEFLIIFDIVPQRILIKFIRETHIKWD